MLEEKEFVININDKRRQLNEYQKAVNALKLEEIEKEKARLREIELAGTRPNNNYNNYNTLGPIGHKVQDKGRSRE